MSNRAGQLEMQNSVYHCKEVWRGVCEQDSGVSDLSLCSEEL